MASNPRTPTTTPSPALPGGTIAAAPSGSNTILPGLAKSPPSRSIGSTIPASGAAVSRPPGSFSTKRARTGNRCEDASEFAVKRGHLQPRPFQARPDHRPPPRSPAPARLLGALLEWKSSMRQNSDGLGNFLPVSGRGEQRLEQQVGRDRRIGLLHFRHARLAGPEPGRPLGLEKPVLFPLLLQQTTQRAPGLDGTTYLALDRSRKSLTVPSTHPFISFFMVLLAP